MKRNNHKKTYFSTFLGGVILASMLSMVVTSTSNAQNNGSLILKVENNRNVKTIQGREYTYTLFISNDDNTAHRLTLSAVNHNTGCENPDGMPSGSNILMNSLLLNAGQVPIDSEVMLEPGMEYKFFLKLSVPENSRQDAWNCTEVQAMAENGNTVVLLLHTFYPNPENIE